MISVIVPIYNVSKYLRRCIDSVLAQTYGEWELICINDGSTDASAKILGEYAARDSRIRVITKENAGVSAARNDGLAAARGDYVLFLDGDDFIHPQMLEITHHIAQKTGVDIVSFRHDIGMHRRVRAGMSVGIRVPATVRAKNYEVGRVKYKCTKNLLKYTTERNHSIGRWKIRHCYPVMHLYKKSLVDGLAFDTDIKIAEDFPWWTRVIFSRPRAAITRLPLYYYVPHWTSALNSARAAQLHENVAMAIMRSYCVVRTVASASEMRMWQKEFLWPFIFTCARAIRNAGDDIDLAKAGDRMTEMARIGCFDNPPNLRARKYRRKIRRFMAGE